MPPGEVVTSARASARWARRIDSTGLSTGVLYEFVDVSHDQVDVLRPCLHGVNEHFGAAVEPKHDQLEKAPGGIEPERAMRRQSKPSRLPGSPPNG